MQLFLRCALASALSLLSVGFAQGPGGNEGAAVRPRRCAPNTWGFHDMLGTGRHPDHHNAGGTLEFCSW